jgi:predicted HicB family RNase H-like nuclease
MSDITYCRDTKMMEYKGYTGIVEFDSDVKTFTGYVADLRDEIYFEGDSVEGLEASMRRAIDHYLEVCEQRGEQPDRPFTGNVRLRLDPSLHRQIANSAAIRHQSMNEWLAEAAEEKLQAH